MKEINMKKLIAKLLVGAFSLVLCVNLSAEEWKTYKFKKPQDNQDSSTNIEFSDDVIILEKGDGVTPFFVPTVMRDLVRGFHFHCSV